MTPNEQLNLYADSPERMLVLSILFLFATALLILSNRRWGAKPAHIAAPSSQQRSTAKRKVDSRRMPAEIGTASPRATSAA